MKIPTHLAAGLAFALAACGIPEHEHPHEHPEPPTAPEDLGGYWVGQVTKTSRDRFTGATTTEAFHTAIAVWVRDGRLEIGARPWCIDGPGHVVPFPLTATVVDWTGHQACRIEPMPTCEDGRQQRSEITGMRVLLDDGVLSIAATSQAVYCGSGADYVYSFTGRK